VLSGPAGTEIANGKDPGGAGRTGPDERGDQRSKESPTHSPRL
jgi:hypothetical protein